MCHAKPWDGITGSDANVEIRLLNNALPRTRKDAGKSARRL